MCYGCELKSTLGEKTMDEYLDIRCDYGVMNAEMTELLNRMLAFEKTITNREQRKAWHATRARLAQAKKIAGERIAKELIQKDLTPSILSVELERLMDPDVNKEMRTKLRDIAAKLGPGGTSERAASAILRLIASQRSD